MKPAPLPLLLAATLLIASCSKPAATDRTGRLLSMAAEEAAGIPNTMDRFTRQLNIADLQLRTARKADAAKSLGLARDTLNVAKKADFDDFHRIAAWTAISQLARAAEDKDMALKASDLALAALNDVQPATERPQYVLSLASELAELRGKAAAVELLDSGSGWAADIMDPPSRRIALIAFTERLISLEAFEDARSALHRDPDPAWRTDTFLALANDLTPLPAGNYARYQEASGGGAGGGRGGRAAKSSSEYAAAPLDDVSPATSPANSAAARQAAFNATIRAAGSFGKDVRYEKVYQQNP